MNSDTWFYSYDPVTHAYTGMVLASEQPENATNVAIGDIANPIFNPDKNSWDGQNIQDIFNDIQSTIADGTNQSPAAAIATLAASVANLQSTTTASLSTVLTKVAQHETDINTLKTQVADLIKG